MISRASAGLVPRVSGARQHRESEAGRRGTPSLRPLSLVLLAWLVVSSLDAFLVTASTTRSVSNTASTFVTHSSSHTTSASRIVASFSTSNSHSMSSMRSTSGSRSSLLSSKTASGHSAGRDSRSLSSSAAADSNTLSHSATAATLSAFGSVTDSVTSSWSRRSATHSRTPSLTDTAVASHSPSVSSSAVDSNTVSHSATAATPSAFGSVTDSVTSSWSRRSATQSRTRSSSNTAAASHTASISSSGTASPTHSRTITASKSRSATVSNRATRSSSRSEVASQTGSGPSATATATRRSLSPSRSASPSGSRSHTDGTSSVDPSATASHSNGASVSRSKSANSASSTKSILSSDTATESGTHSITTTITPPPTPSPTSSQSFTDTESGSSSRSTSDTAERSRSCSISMLASATASRSTSISSTRTSSPTASGPSASRDLSASGRSGSQTGSVSSTATRTASTSSEPTVSRSISESTSVTVSFSKSQEFASRSETASPSPSESASASRTKSRTQSLTASASNTPSLTRTLSTTPSLTTSSSLSLSNMLASVSATQTASVSSSASRSASLTATASHSATASEVRSWSQSATLSATTTASSSDSLSLSPVVASSTRTMSVTESTSATASPSAEVSNSLSSSRSISSEVSVSLSQTTSVTASPSLDTTDSDSASASPTDSATPSPSASPSQSSSSSVTLSDWRTTTVSGSETTTETLTLSSTADASYSAASESVTVTRTASTTVSSTVSTDLCNRTFFPNASSILASTSVLNDPGGGVPYPFGNDSTVFWAVNRVQLGQIAGLDIVLTFNTDLRNLYGRVSTAFSPPPVVTNCLLRNYTVVDKRTIRLALSYVANERISATDDYVCNMTFDDLVFACPLLTHRAYHFSTALYVTAPNSAFSGLQKFVQVAVSAVGILAGGAAVLRQSRANSINSFADCQFSLVDPPGIGDSPLQFGFGSEIGFFLRGAVVGNVIFFFSVFGAQLLLVLALVVRSYYRDYDDPLTRREGPTTHAKQQTPGGAKALEDVEDTAVKGDTSGNGNSTKGEAESVHLRLLRSQFPFRHEFFHQASRVHCPSASIAIGMLTYDGTCTASMALLMHPQSPADRWIGGVGVALAVALVLVVIAVTHFFFACDQVKEAHSDKDEEDDDDASADGAEGGEDVQPELNNGGSVAVEVKSTQQQLQRRKEVQYPSVTQRVRRWLIHSDTRWDRQPNHPYFKGMYYTLFNEYLVASFACTELILSLIIGLASGVMISQRDICNYLAGLSLSVLLVFILATLYVNPFLTRFDMFYSLASNFCAFSGALLLFVFSRQAVPDDRLSTTAQNLATVVSAVNVVKFLSDLYERGHRVRSVFTEKGREKMEEIKRAHLSNLMAQHDAIDVNDDVSSIDLLSIGSGDTARTRNNAREARGLPRRRSSLLRAAVTAVAASPSPSGWDTGKRVDEGAASQNVTVLSLCTPPHFGDRSPLESGTSPLPLPLQEGFTTLTASSKRPGDAAATADKPALYIPASASMHLLRLAELIQRRPAQRRRPLVGDDAFGEVADELSGSSASSDAETLSLASSLSVASWTSETRAASSASSSGGKSKTRREVGGNEETTTRPEKSRKKPMRDTSLSSRRLREVAEAMTGDDLEYLMSVNAAAAKDQAWFFGPSAAIGGGRRRSVALSRPATSIDRSSSLTAFSTNPRPQAEGAPFEISKEVYDAL